MTKADLHANAREIQILTTILGKLSHQSFEQRLNQCDLPVNSLQVGIMGMLNYKAHTITELSRKFMLDPSTLVPVVDALERKGFVTRGKDPSDRRRSPLLLTDDGHAVLARVPPIGDDHVLVNALVAMGADRVEQFLTLLRELMMQMPDGQEILHEVSSRIHQMQPGTRSDVQGE